MAWSSTSDAFGDDTSHRRLDGHRQHHHQCGAGRRRRRLALLRSGADDVWLVIASGSAGDVGDVFFVSAGTDTLTGGSGGGNSFVVVNGADLSTADTIDGNSGSGNALDFASGTSGDTLTIGSNVTDVQEVDVVGPTFARPTPRRSTSTSPRRRAC